MIFNEDARVKIPAILHLMRLGYEYLSLKTAKWDERTNIFPDVFFAAVTRLNPGTERSDIQRLLDDITLELENEDLGRAFYQRLLDQSGTKLIDFSEFDNNSFHVVTELTCKNGDDEFRPDITLLVNGIPVAFIEVKIPNNRDGILAERKRIEVRSQNSRFRRFMNITQLMVFSNNMEYDDTSPEPIAGAFYATPSYSKPVFNYFREEEQLDLETVLAEIDDETENLVLRDNNLPSIKQSPEFMTNKDPDTPTNRVCTSLFSRERLAFFLRYGFAYVKESAGIQKHVMRYPQFFATRAIRRKLNDGVKKGIIWHTQGSGKTALAFFNVHFLTDYFQQRSAVAKFYFIVDRLDLATQAQREFADRGLVVHTISSKEDFARDIKATRVVHNHSGKAEITVVNIQKFRDDSRVVKSSDYDIAIQRVYFLDEVHRSYNPTGSFLANLMQSDRNAIMIGLTGTPLLGTDHSSRKIFGDYIHKYYYNASIADGYTLRLMREEIGTSYRMSLKETLAELEVKHGEFDRTQLYAHRRFVEPMLDYILDDFARSRRTLGDDSIGGMVICDSSEQAREMFRQFKARIPRAQDSDGSLLAAEKPSEEATSDENQLSGALVLYDSGSKGERKDWVADYKEGKLDILFVYNMLLTGFDAPRLKKLYLGRVVKSHNLLQALTRVNRPYRTFRHGYVVDFADIKKEFDKTNQRYLKELQEELGDELDTYSHLFKSPEEIELAIEAIKDILFRFNTANAEEFSRQITQIDSREEMMRITDALADARSLHNLIRTQGDEELLARIDFEQFNRLYREARHHLDLLNLKEQVENADASLNLLNVALEDVLFTFTKLGQEELIIADQLKESLRKTREAMADNFDQQDPRFVTLKEELERLFKKKKLDEISPEEMKENISALEVIYKRAQELNRENDLIRDKYAGDPKYARLHKRLLGAGDIQVSERRLFEALSGVKTVMDEHVLSNTQIVANEGYFARTTAPAVIGSFQEHGGTALDAKRAVEINRMIVAEYLSEYASGTRAGAATW